MTTAKPRITVTLTDEQYAVLRRMSDSSGQPMSGFITDLLQSALPTLERMSGTFQQIRSFQDERRTKVLAAMDEAQAAFEPLITYLLTNAGIVLEKGLETEQKAEQKPLSEERSDRTKKSSAKAVTTSTNRGVTPPVTDTPKTRRGKASWVSSGKKVFPKS